MYLRSACLVNFLFLIVVIASTCCQGRPNREKRYSDQRLAELETLYKLQQLKGQFSRGPLDYSRIDPNILGRRRRSSELLLDQLRAELDDEREKNVPAIDEDLWHSLLLRAPNVD